MLNQISKATNWWIILFYYLDRPSFGLYISTLISLASIFLIESTRIHVLKHHIFVILCEHAKAKKFLYVGWFDLISLFMKIVGLTDP